MEIALLFSLFSPDYGSFCDFFFYQFSSPRSDARVQRCSAGYPELDKQAKDPGCGVRRSRVHILTCRPYTGANEPLTSQPNPRKRDLTDLKSLVDGFFFFNSKVLGTAESGSRCHPILPSWSDSQQPARPGSCGLC